MRRALCEHLVSLYGSKPFVFLTGDLGYMALEPLRDAMGPRFINMGVAEQNMVGVAAGLAKSGEAVWAYSIAPFIYARALEQIRNDICLHALPVRLVGNGGGYGYGVMGATHHAIEDYGILLALQKMNVYVPAFRDDVAPIISAMEAQASPVYLRLGQCEKPAGFVAPAYAPLRRLLTGNAGVAIAVGPIAGSLWEAYAPLAETERPELWVLSKLPLNWEDIPPLLKQSLALKPRLAVIEEHVKQGGAGQMLAGILLEQELAPCLFAVFCAQGYPSGTYGSQHFHRQESGLTASHVLGALADEK